MIAIYARQSLDKKDSISIESQIDLCKKNCVQGGSFLVFQDKGFSGKNTERPEFQSMMDAVRSGKVEKIVVYKLDRLSRNIADFANLWMELENYHAQFASVRESFDTSTPMGKAMVFIILTFAQLERETTAVRVKDNYYIRIKSGSWPGGPAPFGFDNAKVVDELGRRVPTLQRNDRIEDVKRIFYEYTEPDTSLGSIAKRLTEDGVPSPKRKGNSWDNVTVARILHNPVYVMADIDVYSYYKGRGITQFSNDIEAFDGSQAAHVVGKRNASTRKYTDLKDHVLSLTNFAGTIPSDIWLKCQYKLDHNNQIKNSGKGKYSWVSGYIKCAECGYSVQVKKSYKNLILSCIGRTHYHICDVDKFQITYKEIEDAVQAELEKMIEECGSVAEAEDERILEDNSLKMEITRIDEKIERLVKSLEESTDVVMEYINREIGRLDKKKRSLLEEADKSNRRKSRKIKEIVFYELTLEEKRMAVDAFIEKILVSRGGIEIVWKV